jgi:hypothetical protein
VRPSSLTQKLTECGSESGSVIALALSLRPSERPMTSLSLVTRKCPWRDPMASDSDTICQN